MDLKEFVKEALQQINDGIHETINDLTQKKGNLGWVNPVPPELKTFKDWQPYIQKIDFEVAVTAGEKKGGGGGASLSVAIFKLDANGKIDYENTSVSKVKFSVPFLFAASKVGFEPEADASKK